MGNSTGAGEVPGGCCHGVRRLVGAARGGPCRPVTASVHGSRYISPMMTNGVVHANLFGIKDWVTPYKIAVLVLLNEMGRTGEGAVSLVERRKLNQLLLPLLQVRGLHPRPPIAARFTVGPALGLGPGGGEAPARGLPVGRGFIALRCSGGIWKNCGNASSLTSKLIERLLWACARHAFFVQASLGSWITYLSDCGEAFCWSSGKWGIRNLELGRTRREEL